MSDRNPMYRRSDNQLSAWPWRLTLATALLATRRERGTVLLMVVGVLALLAIIGVVYATIGQADRRGAATNVKNQRVNDQVEEVAAYLAGVIGDATSATYQEAMVGGSRARRRGYTYPWTDGHFLSVNQPATNYNPGIVPPTSGALGGAAGLFTKFDPTGNNPDRWLDATTSDPREPSDPYLAVLEPEWLRAPNSVATVDLTKLHDWRHISNFAPSGNFVNLANLRKSNSGGFDAPPGFQQGNMSFGLTLNKPANGTPQSHTAQQNLPGGGFANAARPADWSNNQVYAARPAVADATFSPSKYEYVFNQWADADGDGFFDSRWFELTDMSGLFGTTRHATQVVPSRGRVRLMCAARCIDSSGKINVNVAGDFRTPPWPTDTFVGKDSSGTDRPLTRDNALPPGMTPSDIDLRRVLNLLDTNLALQNMGIAAGKRGYAGLPAPSATMTDRRETDYSGVQGPAAYNAANARAVGDAAYSALVAARRVGSSYLSASSASAPTATYSMSPLERFQQYDTFGADPYSASPSIAFGSYVNVAGVRAMDSKQRALRSPFDMSDELELATFFGVNDSEALSRLEAAIGVGGVVAGFPTFSPLRDNRPRSLEMAHRDEIDTATLFGGGTGAPQETLLSVFTDVRHLLTTYSGSRPIKDESVAPADGVDPATTDVSFALKTIQEFAQNPRLTPVSADLMTRYQAAVKLIFRLYANAIAPYTNNTQYGYSWGTTLAAGAPDPMGLVYGGNPELAIRMAAHMTVNLIDAFDRDREVDPLTGRPVKTAASVDAGTDRNDPTVFSVDLAAMPVTTGTITGYTPARSLTKAYGGAGATDTLALDGARLASATTSPNLRSSSTYTTQAGRMRVIGTEPQPFLTEFSAMQMYTDAPNLSGGDVDFNDEGGPVGGQQPKITISMKPQLLNSDFLGELLAFQLTNPFDQDVVLYDSSASTGTPPDMGIVRHQFYIEYSGRYYTFAAMHSDTLSYTGAGSVILRAGHTQTFYALNPGTLKEFGERIKHVNEHVRTADQIPVSQDFTVLAQNWIMHQLQVSGAGSDNPIQLTQVYPTTFHAVDPGASPSYIAGQHDMDLFGKKDFSGPTAYEHLDSIDVTSAQHRVCQLWRTVQSKSTLYQGVPPGTMGDDSALGATVNDVTNDILVDRMHDPSNPTSSPSGLLLEIRDLPTRGDHVGGTQGGNEQSSTTSEIHDNTGFSAILWTAVRRPTDVTTAPGVDGGTLNSNGRSLRGVLPPWCLEAKFDNKWGPAVSGVPVPSLNKTFKGYPDIGDIGKYNSSSSLHNKERFTTLQDMMSVSNTQANTEIGKPCAKKGIADTTKANPIGKNNNDRFGTTPNGKEYSQVAVEYHSVGEDLFGGQDSDQTTPVRRSRNPAMFSRSGDFLLPLAIGAWFDPSRSGAQLATASRIAQTWTADTGTPTYISDREASWMTLSEAMALSCGYYSPEDPNDALYEFGVRSTVATHLVPARADRGHLVLDHFTPFFKVGANVAQPLGSGVPFALSIIDQFRAATGISSTPVNHPVAGGAPVLGPEQQTRDFAYGGGTTDLKEDSWPSLHLRQGVTNVNTQVTATLRAMPLLSPEPIAAAWMRVNQHQFDTGNQPPLDGSLNYDLAPLIKAYRDGSREDIRSETGAYTGTGTGVVDFFTARRGDLTQKGVRPAPATFDTEDFDGLRREAKGIKSLGELAAINLYSPTHVLDENSMFRFAKLETTMPMGTLGSVTTAQRLSFYPEVVSSRFYNHLSTGAIDKAGQITMPASVAVAGRPIYAMGGPELPNGYQDKLAIVNALTNTASVRSDVFTVYFLIHGYTAEDVDVDDNQPLVPSVAKRYVMVVDRSNVVAKGDKPRILMLKEVPIP